jgi:hypothetical protein
LLRAPKSPSQIQLQDQPQMTPVHRLESGHGKTRGSCSALAALTDLETTPRVEVSCLYPAHPQLRSQHGQELSDPYEAGYDQLDPCSGNPSGSNSNW